jgi:hypothetical protein
MILINQHGPNGELYDLLTFLEDIDLFFEVDHWKVGKLECTGQNALAIEEKCGDGVMLADEEFRDMYKGIFQTIWGSFSCFTSNELLLDINAFDSTYWELTSSNSAFNCHMKKKYGLFKSGNLFTNLISKVF